MNGVAADQSVNADKVKIIGKSIIENMIGKYFETFAFRKKDQIIPMSCRTAVKINGDTEQVDPQLLFQRLIATVPTSEDLKEVFKYELCSFPSSLFDSNALPRQANKSQLADALWDLAGKTAQSSQIQSGAYVLDGGALLQRVPWPRGKTYQEICTIYAEYIKKKYGENITTVFDGYSVPSTKDVTHMRRTKIPSPTVSFT